MHACFYIHSTQYNEIGHAVVLLFIDEGYTRGKPKDRAGSEMKVKKIEHMCMCNSSPLSDPSPNVSSIYVNRFLSTEY